MKKIFTLGMLAILVLSSCGDDSSKKGYLSFGRVYDNVNDVFSKDSDQTYASFKQAADNEESFIMFTYNTYTCGCYITFRDTMKQYLFDNNIDILTINASELEGKETYGFNYPSNSNYFPSIALFKDGKAIKQINYSSDNDVFTNLETFKALINDNFYLSKMYHISKDFLDDKISNDNDFLIYFRQETCPDCAEFFKSTLLPYVKNNYESLKDNYFYMMDKNYDFGEDIPSDKDAWQDVKDDYGLSNKYNVELGYNTGYVPTVQYYSKSAIEAMMVFYNDSFSDGKVARSYYTSDMIKKQEYLNNDQSFILEGKSATKESELLSTYTKISGAFFNYYWLETL